MTADAISFYASLGIELPSRDGPSDVTIRCFANPERHHHSDRRRSCAVSLLHGAWRCHGCGAQGGAYDAAIALGLSPSEAMGLLERHGLDRPPTDRGGRPQTPRLSTTNRDLERYASLLLGHEPALSRLRETHAWTPEALRALGVGADPDVKRLTFPIRGGEGELVGVVRYARRQGEPKSLAERGSRRELFPAPETVPVDVAPLLIVEGEGDALTGTSLGLATVGVPGAASWKSAWAGRFAGRELVLIPDADEQGRDLMGRVAGDLQGVASEVRVLDLAPDRVDGYDLSDWTLDRLDGRRDDDTLAEVREWLLELVAQAAVVEAVEEEHEQDEEGDEHKPASSAPATGGKKSQATKLIEIAVAELDLFHDPDLVAYAILTMDSHREVYPLRSGAVKTWLARAFYAQEEKGCGSQALNDALAAIEGKARFDAPEHGVHTRIAEHDGAIYVDLCDKNWSVVRVTPDGWEIVPDSPVMFRRAKAMRPLPYPIRGGSVEALRPFLNLERDEDWVLAVSWLAAAYRPRGPYSCLCLNGEQGSAKTSTGRRLRSLVDPNEAMLRSEPRNEHDLVIAAKNGWLVGFDNVSSLPSWLSDAICRLATGSGFGTRKLYEDDEEMIFSACRPVLLNGIEEVITRGDLLDRALILSLPRIVDERRRNEHELDAEFEAARPGIIGAILDAVAVGLRNVDSVRLESPPRMADFATWVVAVEPALPWQERKFLTAYENNRGSAVALTLDTSPLVEPIKTIATEKFSGTATALLAQLEKLVADDIRRQKAWPGSAQALGGQLRRLAPSLRSVGVDVSWDRSNKSRTITVARCELEQRRESPSPPSPPSPLAPAPGLKGDGTGDSNSTRDSTAPRGDAAAAATVTPQTAWLSQDDKGDSGDGGLQSCSKNEANGHVPVPGDPGFEGSIRRHAAGGHLTIEECDERLALHRALRPFATLAAGGPVPSADELAFAQAVLTTRRAAA